MRVTKKTLFIAINVLLLTAIAVSYTSLVSMGNVLQSQKSAERWRGESEERFAQISCFFPVGQGISGEQVGNIRSAVDQKLKDSSLEAQEGGTLWTDAYSSQGTLNAESKYGSSAVKGIGVGGDYFFFHNFRLLSGSYISSGDIMKDKVVLDEMLAWKLFGSSDLEGMEITINGVSFLVAGVIESETDRFSRRVYGEEPVLYIPYEVFLEMTGAPISCYEAVLPNQITGFAQDIIKTSMPSPDNTEIVENSARYSLNSLISLIRDFGSRSIQEKGMVYPYWENAARLTEDNMALLLIIISILAIVPAISLIVISVMLIRLLTAQMKRAFRTAFRLAEKRLYDKRSARYYGSEDYRRGQIKQGKKVKKLPSRRRAVPTPAIKAKDSGVFYSDNTDEELKTDIESIVREILEEDWE